MNTPNKITLSRLLLIPLIVFFYLADFIPYGKLVATVVFIVACLTDFLDGYLARKNNQVTLLGKFFDSIADKVLIMTGLLLIVCPSPYAAPAVYPSWVGLVCVVIILAREFIVSALRQIAAAKGVVLAADMGGKVKATFQYIAVSLYMIIAFVMKQFFAGSVPRWLAAIRFVALGLLVVATILTIYSGISYLVRNKHVFKETQTPENSGKEEWRNPFPECDPFLVDAVLICIEEQNVSASLLQRKLTIGYPRAIKLLEEMEAKGYFKLEEDGKTRTLTITKEELEKQIGKN